MPYKDIIWLNDLNGLEYEIVQAEDEGKPVGKIKKAYELLISSDTSINDKLTASAEIYDEVQSLGTRKSFRHTEPSSYEEICRERPKVYDTPFIRTYEDPDIYNRIYGAWLGRCIGCLLGKPAEGWKREKITDHLIETSNFPVERYLVDVEYMPEDDDINYTLTALKTVEIHGTGFTSNDIADIWLSSLPVFRLCTAERVAYRNLVNSVAPPDSASLRNPYREWIGAQIRADFYGYITPGKHDLGAQLAFRDACVSHVKNGIYGAMFIAAMLSAAACTQDMAVIISTGLGQIPENSRMSEAVDKVLHWYKEGVSWEKTIDNIHNIYDENNSYHWGHVIPNLMIVIISMLYGQNDFDRTIGMALRSGLDTDCNTATAGSILGLMTGADNLSKKWTVPLNDNIKSGVHGFEDVKISDMAERTVRIIESMNGKQQF